MASNRGRRHFGSRVPPPLTPQCDIVFNPPSALMATPAGPRGGDKGPKGMRMEWGLRLPAELNVLYAVCVTPLLVGAGVRAIRAGMLCVEVRGGARLVQRC